MLALFPKRSFELSFVILGMWAPLKVENFQSPGFSLRVAMFFEEPYYLASRKGRGFSNPVELAASERGHPIFAANEPWGDHFTNRFRLVSNMGVEPKIGGNPPKMDGLFHGKPYEQIHDLGASLFLETPI